MRVAVVGGGISGIRTALSLAWAGCQVTLLEKNRHLGGRVFSFSTPEFGEIDIGQHIWLRSCVALEELLRDLAVPEDWVFRQQRVAMPYRWADGTTFEFAAGAGPAALALLPLLWRVPKLGLIDRLRYLMATARLRFASPATLEALDALPFSAWLKRQGQSRALIQLFWEPFVKGVCNGPLHEVSARHALLMVRQTLLESPEASAICLLRCPLSAVFDRLARAALGRAGVEVRTGSCIALVQPGKPPCVVWSGNREPFDHIVLALPRERLRGVLPSIPLPPEPGTGAIVGLLLRFARPVMAELFFTAVGGAVQHVFNKTTIWRQQPADGSQVIELVLSAAERERRLGGDGVASELLPELGKLLPAVRSTPILARRLLVHAAATFRVAPGGEAHRLDTCQRDVAGIVFAGDHTRTGLPSTMESAARAGQAAAQAVLSGRC